MTTNDMSAESEAAEQDGMRAGTMSERAAIVRRLRWWRTHLVYRAPELQPGNVDLLDQIIEEITSGRVPR